MAGAHLAEEAAAMEPLDLTKHPPRSPRERLGGLVMLARTIDKLRATLPGGNPGAYYIPGFSSRLLTELRIEEPALRDAVARASNDDDVVQWVRRHSDPSRYDEINAGFENRRIRDRINDADFLPKYPFAKDLPPDMPLLEMLDRDDARLFSA
jgi:hypothetical protein